jgi:hypothetical protein
MLFAKGNIGIICFWNPIEVTDPELLQKNIERDRNNLFLHRGSQLYFHITRYVLKRRREDTFWGAKSESRVLAPFFASKTV